jgi:hypothetical protein
VLESFPSEINPEATRMRMWNCTACLVLSVPWRGNDRWKYINGVMMFREGNPKKVGATRARVPFHSPRISLKIIVVRTQISAVWISRLNPWVMAHSDVFPDSSYCLVRLSSCAWTGNVIIHYIQLCIAPSSSETHRRTS